MRVTKCFKAEKKSGLDEGSSRRDVYNFACAYVVIALWPKRTSPVEMRPAEDGRDGARPIRWHASDPPPPGPAGMPSFACQNKGWKFNFESHYFCWLQDDKSIWPLVCIPRQAMTDAVRYRLGELSTLKALSLPKRPGVARPGGPCVRPVGKPP